MKTAVKILKKLIVFISAFLILTPIYANGPTLKKVEVKIDALPSDEKMHVKTKLYLQKAEGMSGKASFLYFMFLKPEKLHKFIDQSTGKEIDYLFRFTKEMEIQTGYNIIQFQLEINERDTILLLEYEYDRETFSGYYLSPTTYGNLRYGQITKDCIYSTHLYYYPSIGNDPGEAEITILAPNGWVGVTSGKLVSTSSSDRGKEYKYLIGHSSGRTPYPLAIYPYKEISAYYKERLPITIYFDEKDRAFAEEKLDTITGKILPFLENLMGQFPYETLRIAEVFPWEGEAGAALKSFIILSDKIYFSLPIKGDYRSLPATVLADEIAHQWNFYKVKYPNYLSEGISTYTDLLFHEHILGESVLLKEIERYKTAYKHIVNLIHEIKVLRDQGLDIVDAAKRMGKSVPEIQPYWRYAEFDELPINDPRIFNALYFLKGAIAIHALRVKLGNEVFFEGFKGLFSTSTEDELSLKDYQRVFEEASGQSLEGFFKEWYFGIGLPES